MQQSLAILDLRLSKTGSGVRLHDYKKLAFLDPSGLRSVFENGSVLMTGMC